MIVDKENSNHILAEEGKVLKRISDGSIYGKEAWLGYTYYLGGVLLTEPLLELPEHFTEIDEPQDEDTVLVDDERPMTATLAVTIPSDSEDEEMTLEQPKRVITVKDYLELEQRVQELEQRLTNQNGGK